METPQIFAFRKSVSHGRDTYGYNICSLWINGKKCATCKGGGYDMKGKCLADWIQSNFQNELKTLHANYGIGDHSKGFYSLQCYSGAEIRVQGGAGFSAMVQILNALGYKLELRHETRKAWSVYFLDKVAE